MAERIWTIPTTAETERVVVILVGKSPVEASLRREAGVELVRARSALDAIGELGAATDDGFAQTVVLLAPGELAEPDLGRWLEAMRSVDPRTPVLGVRNGTGSVASGLSGWLNEDADGRAIRSALGLTQGTTEATDSQRTPGAEAAPEEAASLFDDERVVGAMLAGQEIIAPALEVLRRRVGPAVRFESASDGGPAPVAGLGECLSACVHRDQTLGWLIGPEREAPEVRRGAAWLARWLALGEQHAQLRVAAFTDPLTGAWNRRYLDRFLNAAIGRARAKRHDVTLLLFDIDNFKHYNDRYGHPAGDEILVETVKLLNSVIRPTDRVARIGGDEFAVVFDDPTGPRDPASRHPASIYQIAQRFQRQIVEHRFPKLGEQARGSLTISGGLATFPWDAQDARSLIERADALILQSKGQGKNVICIGAGAKRAIDGC